MRFKSCKGQSVVESAVVLALIAIIATTILWGIGESSRDRLAAISAVNAGVESDPGKATTASAGGGKTVATGNSRQDAAGGQASESSSETIQKDLPANEDR